MAAEEIPATLTEAIRSGDPRTALTAIRDYLAHELEGNRCKTCAMSQLRTGDTAALVLRLMKVMEEIQALPVNTGEVTPLDRIRARRDNVREMRPTGQGDRPLRDSLSGKEA